MGLGSDMDGVEDLPGGMTGVDGFPLLLKELMRRGRPDADLRALLGANLLRVMAANEDFARSRSNELPSTASIEELDRVPAAH